MKFDYLESIDIDAAMHGITFVSQRAAIEHCLEVLGTRALDTHVIVPVTCPPDILAGVLKAEAKPIVLDICQETLSYDPVLLENTLSQFESSVVILPILGKEAPKNIEKLLEGNVVIKVFKDVPSPSTVISVELFSIYDLSLYLGGGAVVYSQYTKQLDDLRTLRDGVLGSYAQLPISMQKPAERLFKSDVRDHHRNITKVYQEHLLDYSVFLDVDCTSAFFIRVDNAFDVVDALAEVVEAKLGVYPLFKLPEVAERWERESDETVYPNAVLLESNIIALPTHLGVSVLDAKKVCDTINEYFYTIRNQ